MSRSVFTIVVAVLIGLVPGSATAQAPSGAVTGVVRDSSGGAIPGATVRVVDATTGQSLEAVSNEEGS